MHSNQDYAGSKRRPDDNGGYGDNRDIGRYCDGNMNQSTKRPRNDNHTPSAAAAGSKGQETDKHRLEQRLKQIQFGYNSAAYDRYISFVPKGKRQGINEHPRTPDPYQEQSKRAFDGRMAKWRRDLHKWDIVDGAEGEIPSMPAAPAPAHAAGSAALAPVQAPVQAPSVRKAECGEELQAFGEAYDVDLPAEGGGSDDDDEDDVL